MIILNKEGDEKDIKNYRPTSLLSNIYKLVSNVMINILESVLDSNQQKEQAGFRRRFSTIDHIYNTNQLKENTRKLLILWTFIWL